MESRGEARERSLEAEPLSSSQDVVIREISGVDVPSAFPEDASRSKEKRLQHAASRSSIVPASHHRSSQSLDRHGQSSGALDLQSLVGRSGSSSSISGITVPIRLDALSYLLNNAVLGAYKSPAQMPCYPPMYPLCPYTQMGYPYGPCATSPPYNMPYMNQFPACQPGMMPVATQQGFQAFQNPVPSYNQCVTGAAPVQNQSVFPTIPPQSGTSFNTGAMNTTTSVQENRGGFQPEGNTWAQKPSEGFGSNRVNPFSTNSSPPRRGFGRFGDKQREDSWSSRPQNSFTRGSGRGRGDFGGRSWQGNANGQERRFGDRPWNADSGGRRRFQESPDRGSFKRVRWQNDKGKDGENQDGWQQRNQQNVSSPWAKAGTSQDAFKSTVEESGISKTEGSKDEDWEMDYEEPAACKTPGESAPPPLSGTCESPQTLKTSENDNEDLIVEGSAANVLEKEEGDSESEPADQKMMERDAQVQEEEEGELESEPADQKSMERDAQVQEKEEGELESEPTDQKMMERDAQVQEKEEGELESETADQKTMERDAQVQEKEEGELESEPADQKSMESNAQVHDPDPEEPATVSEEGNAEDVYTLVLSVEGGDKEGILVAVDAEAQ